MKLVQEIFLLSSLIFIGESTRFFMEDFPASVKCRDYCDEDPASIFPSTLECEIYIGNTSRLYQEILFNKTDMYEKVYCDGVTTDVPKHWVGENGRMTWTYLVTRLEGGGRYQSGKVEEVEVESRLEFKCMEPSPTHRISISSAANVTLSCKRLWAKQLLKEQFDAINIVWYKGCERIQNDSLTYQYGQEIFSDGNFPSLTITDAGVKKDEGLYHCVAEYKNLTAVLETYDLCILEKKSELLLSMIAHQKQIDVTSGDNVTVQCSGDGDKNTMVVWMRHNLASPGCATTIPEHPLANIITLQENFNCKYKYCPSDETPNSIGTFMSSLTLRNASYEDAGDYTCYFVNDELGYWMNNTDIKETIKITVDGRSAASTIIPLPLGLTFIAAIIVMPLSI